MTQQKKPHQIYAATKQPVWNGIPEDWGKGHYRDVPISKWVRKARERQVRDLRRAADDPNFGCYFDVDEADRAVWFIETFIVHWKGSFAGKPFKLSAWQEWDIIRPLFGWRRKSDGTRRFRRALMMIARRNGKSSLLAAIALYMLVADCEAGAQVFCAATKEEQAKIVWRDAVKFIKRSPKLKRVLRPLAKTILCDMLDAEMKPLGKDSDTQDGLDVHCGIVDEYHAHKDASMLGVLSTGTGSRDQPLIAIISTAGFEFTSPCRSEQEVCERILDQLEGAENDEYFGYICTVDDPEKWDNEVEWYKANPQLGISIKLENFRGAFRQAKLSPTDLVEFKVKNLNIWLSAKDTWLPLPLWRDCAKPIDWAALKGKKLQAFAAFDLGRTQDLSAVALAVKIPDEVRPSGYRLALRVFHFCAAAGIEERSKTDRVPYKQWAEIGWLEETPGRATRTDFILNCLKKIATDFTLVQVVYDPWNVGDLENQLVQEGFVSAEMRQNMAQMSLPCREFEKLVVEGDLEHDANPIMEWQVSHAVVLRDGNGNMKPMKHLPGEKRDSGNRIDGLVASVMAVGRAVISNEAPSPYLTRGIYVG